MNLHQFAETHEVTNQPPSLDGTNLYRIDLPLQEWSRRFDAGWAESRIDAYGALAGGSLMEAGFAANQNKPVFVSHDRYGHRIDLVEFHPAYHELMRAAVEHGLTGLPWTDPQPGAHVARASMTYLHSQAEAGSGCPLTMTFASVPAMRLQPNLADQWLPKNPRHRIRLTQRRHGPQGRGHHRHGHDREAGRHRRAGQHHQGLSGWRQWARSGV